MLAQNNKKVGRHKAIERIEVDDLFGQFSYFLEKQRTEDPRGNEAVFILYGDNGSGKTTILRLLFYLLSPRNDRGHRNAITSIVFKRFSVMLADSTLISLSRKEALTGGYAVTIVQSDVVLLATQFSVVRDRQFDTDRDEARFLAFLQEIDLTIHFLSADRKMRSDAFNVEERDQDEREIRRQLEFDIYRSVASQSLSGRRWEELRDQDPTVVRALNIAAEWIRSQHLSATQRGAESSHHIYADIVSRIAGSGTESPKSTPAQLISMLDRLGKRSEEYSVHGFSSSLATDQIVADVSKVSENTFQIIENVLTPYITGTNARLDQLNDIFNLTATFVRGLNSFLTHKTLGFDLTEGFKIVSQVGQIIDPKLLSSGEKQLLVLFCHALISNGGTSVFIIDEPELSLNIKWQRNLLRALLGVVPYGSVQFVLATHSFELLAENVSSVVKLEPMVGARNFRSEGGRFDSENNS